MNRITWCEWSNSWTICSLISWISITA